MPVDYKKIVIIYLHVLVQNTLIYEEILEVAKHNIYVIMLYFSLEN